MEIIDVTLSNKTVLVDEEIFLGFRISQNSFGYILDENNEQILDEESNPILEGYVEYMVEEVYAIINGQKIIASYDSETDTYSIETNAPSTSSWPQPNHVYEVSLHAVDEAGNSVSMDSTDSTYGDQLKIRVLETSKPVAQIVSPTADSVIGSSSIDIQLKMYDVGDSGLNMSSVEFKINGSDISDLVWADDEDGSKISTYHVDDLSDGKNSISLKVSDNDGNVSDLANVEFIISTAAPSLTVLTPEDGLITNDSSVTVSGTFAPGSESVTISSVKINNVEVEDISNGSFSKETSLVEGDNIITIVVTDSIGKSTSVTRTVVYDFQAPVISDVVAVATTINVDGQIKITFKVTD